MTCVTRYSSIQLEKHENYNKGSFRNKCIVRSNQQNQYLIIPLKKGKNRSTPISEVEIAYDEDWSRVMQNRLQTEYGSYPYYSYYIENILEIVNRRRKYLFELNASLQEYFFMLIDFDNYTYTEQYKQEFQDSTLDLRDIITPQYFHSNAHMLSMVKIGYFRFVPAHSFIETLFSYGPEISLLMNQYKTSLPSIC